MPEVFDDLRGFVEACAKIGEYREVLGADARRCEDRAAVMKPPRPFRGGTVA